MKARWIIFLLSIVNVGLIAALFSMRRTVVLPPVPDVISSPAASLPATGKSELAIVNLTTNNFNWASVESEDYRVYIANLRSIGVPEETLRDIIIADVNKLFARRVAAVYPSPRDYRFWQVEDKATRDDERKREQQRRELEKEKRALVKELLGVDYESELARWSGRPDEESYRLGFLSPEKQQQTQALQAKYRELTRALLNDGSGGRSPESRTKLAALRAQQEAELSQLMGPQDYEQYQLRNSPIARNMRESLATFQPTEEEFRRIFEMRKTIEQNSSGRGEERLTREQRQAAEQQLETQLKATLGEERFAQYQLSQDDRYQSLNEFAERSNVPRETVDSVYEMRRAAEDAHRQVESNPSLSPEARQAALQALAEETRRSVSQSLGESAWKEYQRREGSWIDRLNRGDSRNSDPATRLQGRERYLRR
ncbi:MAG TPA: hypothetical protein VK633_07075 [Verrucomicrobiae bacterium]|nr:hypothetical protein [Verrucomicrobiae bacterium]